MKSITLPGEVARGTSPVIVDEYVSPVTLEANRLKEDARRNKLEASKTQSQRKRGKRKSATGRSPKPTKGIPYSAPSKRSRMRKNSGVIQATCRENIIRKARKARQRVDAEKRSKSSVSKAYQSFKSVVTLDFESPSRVMPFIYLGDRHDAANRELLTKLGVSHILNSAFQIPNYHERHFLYCNLPVFDRVGEDLSRFFEQAATFIKEAKEERTAVLVHCIAGVSRSTTCVIAYLMAHEGMRLLDAYKLVRKIRPIVCPNESFRLQLAHYELALFGSTSVGNTDHKDWNFYNWNKEKGKHKRSQRTDDGCCVVS